MRKNILSGLAVGTMLAGGLMLAGATANAEGLPDRRYAAPPSWTGFYLGAGLGYGSFVNNNVDLDDRVNPSLPSQDTGGKGWLATVTLGYDHQIGKIVVGAFVDYDWNRSSGEWRDRAGGFNVSGDFDQRSSWAVGGRIGVLANPGTLVYVSGGWTDARFDELRLLPFNPAPAAVPQRIPSQDFRGGFIGAGIETQLMSNLSLRLEYRFADFRDESVDRTSIDTGTFRTQVDEHLTEQTIRAVLAYKFNWVRDETRPLK